MQFFLLFCGQANFLRGRGVGADILLDLGSRQRDLAVRRLRKLISQFIKHIANRNHRYIVASGSRQSDPASPHIKIIRQDWGQMSKIKISNHKQALNNNQLHICYDHRGEVKCRLCIDQKNNESPGLGFRGLRLAKDKTTLPRPNQWPNRGLTALQCGSLQNKEWQRRRWTTPLYILKVLAMNWSWRES